MDIYLDWIVQAWDSIPKEAIAKSFRGGTSSPGRLASLSIPVHSDCGITLCYDGSEDDEIHCFKPHGSVPGGRVLLRDEREAAAPCSMKEVPDEEEDENNGYISDNSLQSV
jgi:hypothetical protein